MQLMRFVRTLVPLALLGPFGFVIGCSGEPGGTAPPAPKEPGKQVANERKAERQEAAQERASLKDSMKGGMQDRKQGRGR